MAKSTKVPLSVHKASGYWCKVFKGRRHYFEKVKDDPKGVKSLDQWLEIKAGRTPKKRGSRTVEDLCDEWMTHKQAKLDAGELSQDTWNEYHHTCELVMTSISRDLDAETVQPKDFDRLRSKLAKRYGPVALGKHVGQIRSLFKFGFESGVLKQPAKFGPAFVKPSAKVLRHRRNQRGSQDFTAAEVQQLLTAKNASWRAMITLAVQGGFGNRDVAELTADAVDLDAGWIDYPRFKTGVNRRVPLWPETVGLLREVIKKHPGGTKMLFVDQDGRDFIDENCHGRNRIAGAFKAILVATGFPENGRGFYCLRRTFQTQAEECGDIVAVRSIMGHATAENDMSARYRQRVSDKRLRRAVNTVHDWLYAEDEKGGQS